MFEIQAELIYKLQRRIQDGVFKSDGTLEFELNIFNTALDEQSTNYCPHISYFNSFLLNREAYGTTKEKINTADIMKMAMEGEVKMVNRAKKYYEYLIMGIDDINFNTYMKRYVSSKVFSNMGSDGYINDMTMPIYDRVERISYRKLAQSDEETFRSIGYRVHETIELLNMIERNYMARGRTTIPYSIGLKNNYQKNIFVGFIEVTKRENGRYDLTNLIRVMEKQKKSLFLET
ncbi:MAG: hypothetical protein ACTSX6_01815, partial [Candidatus Heimdallarchaeaceae archaeon]